MKKTTFALFFGNRGFFPASLLAEAREELPRVLKALGHERRLVQAPLREALSHYLGYDVAVLQEA